jgi:predicted RNA-binding protein with PUA-like domain
MRYWLVKADPDTDYSIDDLMRDGTTYWDGVHNFQAIGFIKQWQVGDKIFIYHSQKEKCIVGLAEVASKPEHNTKDPRTSWAATVRFVEKFNNPISLASIKQHPDNADFLLVRNPRLSVMPIPEKTLQWLKTLI